MFVKWYRQNIFKLVAWVGSLFFLGCVTYEQRVADCRSAYLRGDGVSASQVSETLVARYAESDSNKDALLICLEAAQAWRLQAMQSQRLEDFHRSQSYLTRAERIYSAHQKSARISLSREGFSLLTTPDSLPYRGQGYEAIMMCVYQALNAFQLGEISSARQILRRLYRYQQEAVADHAVQIRKIRSDERKSKHAATIQRARDEMTSQTNALLDALPNTTGYAAYVNPFAEFLVAFYHHYAGVDMADYEHARHSLSRVLSMYPENNFLQAEFARYSEAPTSKPMVYIFHESGLAPYLKEMQLLIPIFTGRTISYTGVAFATLQTRPKSFSRVQLCTSQEKVVAEPLCDMDAVVAQAYKDDFSIRLTRTIASIITKTAITVTASEMARHSDDPLIELVTFLSTLLYQATTNVADTRLWSTLPQSFSVACAPLPTDRKVKVLLDGGVQQAVQLPVEGQVWVIYVRTLYHGARPTITTFKIR